ncbi:DUF3575 domain-containing protein [Aquimarina sp. AU474]|uniref:DUF3575 domain-containing protein n=1 Tax=Aquimarina sp. AU474 TaxID=2108529 RepID=UPI000D685EE8|nr:DUF3575 domain-containing protein [Aquimarina sp. AU474]
MKKIGYNILIGLLTIVSLNAQEIESDFEKEGSIPKNNIKVYPIYALSGIIGIGYERVITPKMSINVIILQQFAEPNFDNNVFERNYNLFFETDIRRYLSKRKKSPEGWFVSAGLLTEYNYDRLKNSDNNQTTDVERLWVGGSGKIGYQWIFKKALKGISTEVAGGLAYRTIIEGISDTNSQSGFDTIIDVTVGYSW